jgi:hypothetical protein
VIGVVVETSGGDPENAFQVHVASSGTSWGPYFLDSGPNYLSGFPSGDHLISLVGPPNCTVETAPQPVTLPAAGPTSDTVVVTFAASCTARLGTVRVGTTTSGPVPSSTRFTITYEHFGAWDYGGSVDTLGEVDPNGILVADVRASYWSGADPYWYFFRVELPPNCSVRTFDEPYPQGGFVIEAGDTIEFGYEIGCLP